MYSGKFNSQADLQLTPSCTLCLHCEESALRSDQGQCWDPLISYEIKPTDTNPLAVDGE